MHYILPPRLITNVKSSVIFSTISSITELGEEHDIPEFNPKEGNQLSSTPSFNPLQ